MKEVETKEVETETVDVDAKIKSGEWQTFNITFFAQFESFSIDNAMLVVAAPDYKAALAQFQQIVSRPYKQLVAVLQHDKRDVAFLNLAKADAIFLRPTVEDASTSEEKATDSDDSCSCCDKETCECQKQEK